MVSRLLVSLFLVLGALCFYAPYVIAFNSRYSRSRFACIARNSRLRDQERHNKKLHGARDELLGDSGKKKRKNFSKSKPKSKPNPSQYTSKLIVL